MISTAADKGTSQWWLLNNQYTTKCWKKSYCTHLPIWASRLITTAAAFLHFFLHWAVTVNQSRAGSWLAAATHTPSGRLSPPTFGQPFALLAYQAPGLPLFTHQTLFYSAWLWRLFAVNLPHVLASHKVTLRNVISDELGRPSCTCSSGLTGTKSEDARARLRVAPLTAVRKQLKRHAHMDRLG